MKLYCMPGTCSLAVRIALNEIGTSFALEPVDGKTKKTGTGKDHLAIEKPTTTFVVIDEFQKGPPMIELYTWSTPNGRKISIALEEMELDYRVHPIDIGAGQQSGSDFIARFPNAKIPAIVDSETGVSLFESGAILIYFAERAGRFLPPAGSERWAVLQWLMWQMGGFGPMLGQAAHFLHYQPGKSDYAAERYGNEARRLYAVLDGTLERNEFVAGDYSIADMAIWPWATRFDQQGVDLAVFPNVRRWFETIAGRPAVQRGFAVPDATAEPPALAA